MHRFIPHFTGKFSSPFLERFLVYDADIPKPFDPLDVGCDEDNVELICSETTKKIGGLKEGIESIEVITDKRAVEIILGKGTYEDYLKANAEMNDVVLEKGPDIQRIKDELGKLEKDFVLAVQNNKENKPLQKELFEEYSRNSVESLNELKQLRAEGLAENEKIWRNYFPDETAIANRVDSTQAIHKEIKIQRNLVAQTEINRQVTSIGVYPGQGAEIKDYVALRADVILENHETMKHLKSDPFLRIIEFVSAHKNGTELPRLSLEDRKLLKQIQSSSDKTRFEKNIKSDVRRVTRLKKRTGKRNQENDSVFEKRVHTQQVGVLLDSSTYQLAMMNIAEQAEKIITTDQSENGKGIIPLLSADEEKFLKSIKGSGYRVKNPITDNYDGKTPPALGVDKVDLENFFIYEVVGTWGIVTTLANVMVAFQNGNWEQAVPYILAGGAATYLSADMVFNHTVDKIREPERMAEWIFKEKDNTEYQEFFGDSDEIDLWENIQWPETSVEEKAMKKSLSGMKEIKSDYVDDVLNTEQKEDVEYLEKTKNIDISKTLTPEDFEEGGSLASYLPDMVEVGGRLISKEIFLAKLKNSPNNTPKRNALRYKMFKKTIARIGDQDSYLPHLHTLHGYANKQKNGENNNENTSHQKINRELRTAMLPQKTDLYRKVCDTTSAQHIATSGAHTLKNNA